MVPFNVILQGHNHIVHGLVDSLGNRYHRVPPAKPEPSAGKSKNGNKKHGRNEKKCNRYSSKHKYTGGRNS